MVLSFSLLYNIVTHFHNLFIDFSWPCTCGLLSEHNLYKQCHYEILISCIYAKVFAENLGVKSLGHKLDDIQ